MRSPPHEPGRRPTTERPVHKLSVDLLSTYKKINELFYEAKRRRQAVQENRKAVHNEGYDDENGNYVVQIGEELAGRYIVQDCLGKGSFGVVVKAHDHKRGECVAVKVIKNRVQFFHQAKVEIEILSKLNSQASEEHNIVKLKKVFSWKDHLCLVFELLSFNLYDLLKYTKFHGVSLNLIRKFGYQILKTLEFTSSQAVGIIHCDLKPENILLKNPKRSGIKVIDFGSSCFVNKKMFKYIQSRFYRSPEVILGLQYDCAIDMWSLACILVEMHTGQPLFDGKDEAEQLIKMSGVLGTPPQRLVEQSSKRKNFFQWDSKQKRWILAPSGKDPSRYPKTTLEDILGVATGGPGGRRKGQAGHTEQDYLSFVDLVKKMLSYNPAQRLSPSIALQHPFLNPVPSDITQSTAAQGAHSTSSNANSALTELPCNTDLGASTKSEGSRHVPVDGTTDWQGETRKHSHTMPSSYSRGNTAHQSSRNVGGSDHQKSTQQQFQTRRTSNLAGAGTASYSSPGFANGGLSPRSSMHTGTSPRAGSSNSSYRTGRTRSNSHSATCTYTPPSSTNRAPSSGASHRIAEDAKYDANYSSPQKLQGYSALQQSATGNRASSAHSIRLRPKQPGGTSQAEASVPLSSPRRLGSYSSSNLRSTSRGSTTTSTVAGHSSGGSMRKLNMPNSPSIKNWLGSPTSPGNPELRHLGSAPHLTPNELQSPTSGRRPCSPPSPEFVPLNRKPSLSYEGRNKLTPRSPSAGSSGSGSAVSGKTGSAVLENHPLVVEPMSYSSDEFNKPLSSGLDSWKLSMSDSSFSRDRGHTSNHGGHGGAEPMNGLDVERGR